MIKTKLFACICSISSVVVAATTALTLTLSGERNTQSLHMLSDNSAVAYGLSNIADGATSTIDSLTTVVNAVMNSKVSLSGNVTINSLMGAEELSGFGAGFEISSDSDAEVASALFNLSLGSIDVIDGTIYVDFDKEIIAELPFLFEGVLNIPIDNLEEDMANSYIGQMLLEDSDFMDDLDELESYIEEFSAMMSSQTELPEFDFDSEAFMEDLGDVISDSFDEVMDASNITDLGDVSLNGGSYQGYRAEIPVADLSYILRDAIVFVMTDDNFLNYMEDIYEYSMQMDGSEYGDIASNYGDMGDLASQMKTSAAMLESYWGMIIPELEDVIGKEIAFDIYLTDAVELAGFDIFVGVMDSGRISYDRSEASAAVSTFELTADLTGGWQIGEYADVKLAVNDDTDSTELSFVIKQEKNGDFDIAVSALADGDTAQFLANGSYTGDDLYFNSTVDSLKVIVNDETLCDISFSLAFQPIDSVKKPSSSPEYNLWEMSEDDLVDLVEEISETIEDISSMFN